MFIVMLSHPSKVVCSLEAKAAPGAEGTGKRAPLPPHPDQNGGLFLESLMDLVVLSLEVVSTSSEVNIQCLFL